MYTPRWCVLSCTTNHHPYAHLRYLIPLPEEVSIKCSIFVAIHMNKRVGTLSAANVKYSHHIYPSCKRTNNSKLPRRHVRIVEINTATKFSQDGNALKGGSLACSFSFFVSGKLLSSHIAGEY